MPTRPCFSRSVKSAANAKFVSLYLQSLDVPRALSCWLMYKYGEFKQLAELDIDPLNYSEYGDFEPAYRATKFLSKSAFIKTGIDKRQVALDAFENAERQCRSTNMRLRSGSHHYASILLRMQWKIATVLGDFDIGEFFDSCGWGPGVTQEIKRDTSGPNKFQFETGITRAAYDLFGASARLAYPTWPAWSNPTIVPSCNHVVTVPKNAKTDRVIAVEPGLNLWLQKGCGKMIRRRLRRHGINLNSSDRNQSLARVGSIRNNYATVDFSAASDTIAYELVSQLLPRDWFAVLSSLRCAAGMIGSHVLTYEKFSSMGNGYTFELESLIFYAAAFAISEAYQHDLSCISVFGDDVIIDRAATDQFRLLSEHLGFTVNVKKSYSDGNFRESCGAYWWKGNCVKPFFFKEEFYDEATLYDTANSVRLRHRSGDSATSDGRFFRCWKYLVHQLKVLTKDRLLVIPLTGVGGLVGNFDEACPTKVRGGVEGFWYRHLSANPRCFTAEHDGLLNFRLTEVNGDTARFYGNEYPKAGPVRWRVVRSIVATWPDVGPWI